MGEKRVAPKAAKAAVGIYLQLAQADPAAFLPDVAGALWTEAIVLVKCHDVNRAIASMAESVEVYTILPTVTQGPSAVASRKQARHYADFTGSRINSPHVMHSENLPLAPPTKPELAVPLPLPLTCSFLSFACSTVMRSMTIVGC